ncbi:MAG: 3'-5' exonuclease [Planctomycetota bacterium]
MSGRFPNDEQRAVIEGQKGARLILAPAGTGKTRVMAARLAFAVRGGLDPGRTLSVTFTNRAAREMAARVAETLKDRARQARIETFHGLCAWILRSEAPTLGFPRDYVIYDELDCIDLLKQILARAKGAIRSEPPARFFWRLSERKSNAVGKELSLARILPLFQGPGESQERLVAERYHLVLAERHALDFSDLVHRVRALFEHDPPSRKKWADRFQWIQVDEVQDTHFSEYEVIRCLAERHGNLALFGDVDQTIYEWRGSNPGDVLRRFDREFGPVRRHFLTINHRATKRLLAASDRFAETFEERRTHPVPHPTLPEGDPVVTRVFEDPQAEARWIAGRIPALIAADPQGRIGILARTHRRLEVISSELARREIEHVTVEQFEFFRRQEIKDALARLRILLNPADSGAARRILTRPASGVGRETLATLYEQGPSAGLRLTDLLELETHQTGDPFRRLQDALSAGEVVVFDVETTGLSRQVDEVIEIAASRIRAGKEDESFHRFLRPTRPVGDSERIHGWSDAFLAKRGEDPRQVLSDFSLFVRDGHIVGHNVRFDLEMLRQQCRRVALDWQPCSYDDTLDLARRLVQAERYDLLTLTRTLGLSSRPSHRADDDVGATVELLLCLEPLLREGAGQREALLKKCAAPFEPVARMIGRWRDACSKIRPPDLLNLMLEESGLRRFYEASPARLDHLRRLVEFFRQRDEPSHDPLSAMEGLAQQAALARNVDHLVEGDARIPVVTVHQSKGLEFDTVILAGLCEGEFPSFLAERENRLEEERRLFYVGLTRAKRRLILTGHEVDDRGRHQGASRFLRDVGGGP